MMENSRLEKDKKIEDNIIKDVRNLFRLKTEIDDTTIKCIRILFRLKKSEATKDRVIRDIRNLFQHEAEENDHKPVRVGNFWSNN